MTVVYKPNLIRDVDKSRIKEYLEAGWSLDPQAEDPINLKPVTRVPAVTETKQGNPIETKGD